MGAVTEMSIKPRHHVCLLRRVR